MRVLLTGLFVCSDSDDMLEDSKESATSKTLDELLANQEEVNMIRMWMRSQLTTYFDRPRVRSLLQIVTEMPPEDASYERKHAVPFNALKLFEQNHPEVNQRFFELPE